MESEQDTGMQANELLTRLNTVTPFSKYLAMTLFVALPFLGGWVGYVFSPAKVYVIEKVVEVEPKEDNAQQEVVPRDNTEQFIQSMTYPSTYPVSYRYDASDRAIEFSDLVIGEQYGRFTLEDIIASSEPYGPLQAVFTGEITLVGNIRYDDGMIGEIFMPTIGSLQRLPLIQSPNSHVIGCVFLRHNASNLKDRSIYFTQESDRYYQQYINGELNPFSRLTDLVAIKVSGLRILDPENSNWCIEANVTDFGFLE